MDVPPFRHIVRPAYTDAFDGRRIRPTAVMSFLEDAAAEHCRAIGRDIFQLLESQEGWVLTGGGLRMNRYPRYGERLTVETWISDWRELSGIREYRILSDSGEILGEGGGRWVFWDLSRRRPTRIPVLFKDRWPRLSDSPYRRLYPESTTPCFPAADLRIDPVDEIRRDMTVRRGDVDMYGHLHNTIYLDWLMESVPEGLYAGFEPCRLGLRFFGEALLGDEVTILSRPAARGWLHDAVRRSDGRLLVRGYSEWREKRPALSA